MISNTTFSVRTALCGDALEVVGITVAGSVLLRFILSAQPALSGLTPIVWFYFPLLPLLLRRLPLDAYGYGVRLWCRTSGLSLLVGVGILGTFTVLVCGWRWVLGTSLILPLTAFSLDTVLVQFVLIAIPEELFFRGYAYERLRCWAAQHRLPPQTVAVLLGAALFALAHVVVLPSWWRVTIFFPGCIMGWLRVRSAGLLAPALFHGAGNLLAMALRM